MCVNNFCAGNNFCSSASSFFRECARLGRPLNWRHKNRCPIDCPVNQRYDQCGSSCPASCRHTAFQCSEECIDGCHCEKGKNTKTLPFLFGIIIKKFFSKKYKNNWKFQACFIKTGRVFLSLNALAFRVVSSIQLEQKSTKTVTHAPVKVANGSVPKITVMLFAR